MAFSYAISGPAADPVANVVYSLDNEAIRRVYVEGRPVMVERRIVGVPDEEIRAWLADVTRWMETVGDGG